MRFRRWRGGEFFCRARTIAEAFPYPSMHLLRRVSCFPGCAQSSRRHFPSGIMAVHGRATTSLAVRRQGLTLPQTRSDAARTTGRMAAPPWASPRCPAGAAFSSPIGVLGLDSGVDRVRCVGRQQASSAIGSRNENHDLLASMREPQSHRASPERGENELRRNWDFLSTS